MKKIISFCLVVVIILISTVVIVSAEEITKITPELSKVMENKAPDEFVDICIWTNGYQPNATEMPSWPDKGAARKELKEYYDNWYNTEIVPVVFNEIEYKEIFVGSGNIVVSVRVVDVEKIASYGIVRELEYFENRVTEDESAGVYEDKYIEYYSPDECYYYEELYFHSNNEQEIDWVLINAYSGLASSIEVQMDIGNVVLYSEELYNDFRYKYGVYDVKECKFYDIFELRDEYEKYDNLLNVLAKMNIGRLIGDSDDDGVVTILDATFIQMCIAKVKSFTLNDHYVVYDTSDSGYISDFDGDGEVSIMDATAIQLEIAKLN